MTTSSPVSNSSKSESAPAFAAVRTNFLNIGARLQQENDSRDREKSLNLDFSRSREGSGKRPRPLPMCDLPAAGYNEDILRRRPVDLQFPSSTNSPLRVINRSEIELKMREIIQLTGILSIDGVRYQASPDDLQHLGELGTGSCGHVVKMIHKPSGRVLAVKQMRRSGNPEESKRIIMDLDVVLKSHDCPYIVQCMGCFVTDADVWICMELMSTCLDKLLKKLGNKPIPEPIIGKIAVAMVKALYYLKDVHGVIHRDVKPSNILLDQAGQVKLCDFGISGRLVDSKAKTRTAGSAAYMAPERIEPPDPTRPDYDIRADVWSMGITLVELATGVLPYSECKSEFEALTKVLEDESPSLPHGMGFSREFRSFVEDCLTKNYKHRPKYKRLIEHEFIRRSERMRVDVAAWFSDVQAQTSGIKTPISRRRTPPPPSPHQQSYLRARRTPEPERFVPELWAPRGRYSDRSGLYNFLGLSSALGSTASSQQSAGDPHQRRYISAAFLESPLLMRRQEAKSSSNGPSSLPSAQPVKHHGWSPLPSRALASADPYGRGYYTPEPHRRPFAHHRSHQYMSSRP